jgi:hypothetical protein
VRTSSVPAAWSADLVGSSGRDRLISSAGAAGWSNRRVSSRYRFSPSFVVRLAGAGLVAVGVLLLVLVGAVALLALPRAVLTVGLLAAALAVAVLGGLATRRPVVVRLDEAGYQVRYVRGAGVRRAAWDQVDDAAAATVAGERCVVLHLRDGRTTTVPVGVLAGRPDDFVRDLQRHLDRGHGYRPVPRAGG